MAHALHSLHGIRATRDETLAYIQSCVDLLVEFAKGDDDAADIASIWPWMESRKPRFARLYRPGRRSNPPGYSNPRFLAGSFGGTRWALKAQSLKDGDRKSLVGCMP